MQSGGDRDVDGDGGECLVLNSSTHRNSFYQGGSDKGLHFRF